MRAQGLQPISAVDDLTMHSTGNWIDDFSRGIASAAKREGISIVGGEMAQMPDTYAPNYVGVIAYVVGLL
jgi:phosphoribosylaminoimidazole (AIR) synthetase